MPDQQYLSTDPNAGQSSAPVYLSTDPSVGERPPDFRSGVVGDTSALSKFADWLSSIGGAVGGVTGGIPGAALGGAAGEGYSQLLKHGAELPGAASDIWNNLTTQPGAMVKGFASGAGQGAEDSGIQGGLQALYELGGKAVTSGLSAGGRAVYRGYLKPSLSARLASKASQIVDTGIREAIPITAGGAEKADALVSQLNGEVQKILQNSPGDISLSDVADKVRAFAKSEYYRPGKPLEDYNAVMKVADELDGHPSLANPFNPGQPATATLPAANKIKSGIYDTIGDNFGVESGAATTARKVSARGVKEAIQAQAPAVGPLNARQGQLIDLANAVNRATGREANRNALFGVPSMVSGLAGVSELAGGASPYAATAMGLASRMGLSPAFASRAAIIAARLGDQVPGTAVADVARAAVESVRQLSQGQEQQ